VLQTFSWDGLGRRAFVARNGTLQFSAKTSGHEYPAFQPVGGEANWLAVQLHFNWLVALKRDGTLWKWNLPTSRDWNSPETAASYAAIYKQPPVQLGVHDDWVALGGNWNCMISLAADGSLWAWPGTDGYEFALMKPPKQPQLLDRVY
jgi:alpha-tubulin suppressor-like RCC1 family protein